MKEFLSALFFGHSILLTPTPVVIGASCIELKPSKVLEAINSSAVLEIKLSPGTNGTPKTVDVVAASKELGKLYPIGSVTAVLYRVDGSNVTALNTDVAVASDFYGLMLRPPVAPHSAANVLPSFQGGDKFTRVAVCSKFAISDAQVYWQNSME